MGTPKEWAAKCMDALDQNSPDCSVSETIALYIEKAVQEERERCINIIETSGCLCEPPGCYDAVYYEQMQLMKIREGK